MSILSLHRKERSNISMHWVVSGSCWNACHDPIVGSKTFHSRLPEGMIGKRGHPESTYALKVGGWVWSKAYTRVQGRWIGQKCDDLRRMYFLDDPKGGSVLQKRVFVFPSSTMYRSFSSLSEQVFLQSECCTLQKSGLP